MITLQGGRLQRKSYLLNKLRRLPNGTCGLWKSGIGIVDAYIPMLFINIGRENVV